MTRVESNTEFLKGLSKHVDEASKDAMTDADYIGFELMTIASLLVDISTSLAVIADKMDDNMSIEKTAADVIADLMEGINGRSNKGNAELYSQSPKVQEFTKVDSQGIGNASASSSSHIQEI